MNRRKLLYGSGGLALYSALARTPLLVAEQPGSIANLKDSAQSRGIILGVQADPSLLNVPQLAKFIAANFQMLTPGNELKWNNLRPTSGTYNFGPADGIFAFAAANNMLIHGHNLCWNQSNPSWLASVLTKQNAQQYLTDHIQTVMTHCKGKVDSWDVVNEPIRAGTNRPDGLTPGIWLDLLGPQYIDIAFHAAAAADPGALRVLNLDNTEAEDSRGEKTRAFSYQLIQQLLKRNVPVQAIGLESHLDGAQSTTSAGRDRFIQQVRSLGLEVLITELDVNDTAIPGSDSARKKAVAMNYYTYLTDVIPVSAAKRVIFWTLTDHNNWYEWMAARNTHYVRSDGKPHYPGLLNDEYEPNPALGAVQAALGKRGYS